MSVPPSALEVELQTSLSERWPANAEEQRILGQCFKYLRDWVVREACSMISPCPHPQIPVLGSWCRRCLTASIMALEQALVCLHLQLVSLKFLFSGATDQLSPWLGVLLPAVECHQHRARTQAFPQGLFPSRESDRALPPVLSSSCVPRREDVRPAV